MADVPGRPDRRRRPGPARRSTAASRRRSCRRRVIVPSRFDWNGSVWATQCGVERRRAGRAATMTQEHDERSHGRPVAATSLRSAVAPGPAGAGAQAAQRPGSSRAGRGCPSIRRAAAAAAPSSAVGTIGPRTALMHHVELGVEDEVPTRLDTKSTASGVNSAATGAASVIALSIAAHAALAAGRVGDAERQRLLHLGVDRLVAEAGDVDRGVEPGVERRAAEQHVQEVRGGRVVLVPLRDLDLHLVVGVLDVGELDVRRDRLDARPCSRAAFSTLCR